MAQLFHLASYPHYTRRIKGFERSLPPLFRITGYRDQGWPAASKVEPEPYVGYTLDPHEAVEYRCQAAQIQEVHHPDPALDRRWVMLVLHESTAAANAFVAGFDAASGQRCGDIEIYRTPQGIFSLATRKPVPGCPPSLFIYEYTLREFRESSQLWIERTESIVIGPHGQRLEARDAYP